MCDDDDVQRFEQGARALTRRELVGLGAALAVGACGGGPVPATSPAASAPRAGSERGPGLATHAAPLRAVQVPTPDGVCDAWFMHASTEPAPALILWTDIASVRPVFERMAQRLAAAGYAVLLVNPYYRGAKAPLFAEFREWMTEAGKARVAPLRAALTRDAVQADARAHVAWLDAQPEVDASAPIGTLGFCMGGPIAVYSAAASSRIGAVASLHGGGLVVEGDDSPHRLLGRTNARYLFAIAQNDDAKQPQAKLDLRAAAEAAQRAAEIEVYPADHGWVVADSPAYDAAQAEQAWSRIEALFRAARAR